MTLEGSHAVVTGGGTGIGAAIARALAAQGARLTLLGRREEKLREVAASIPGTAVAAADVTRRSDIETAFDAARRAHGPIGLLINNAGAAPSGRFASISEETWREVMAVNLEAAFHCCQAALDDLLAASAGRIIMVASTAGLRGYAYTAPYVAAKHGVIGLTRALAAEFAGTALTVNAVCPGFTETAIVADAIRRIEARAGRTAAEAKAELTRFNPQGRLIQPDEVADTVAWLCRPESGSVTGQSISISGGETT